MCDVYMHINNTHTSVYAHTVLRLRLVTISDSELLLRSICWTELARPII